MPTAPKQHRPRANQATQHKPPETRGTATQRGYNWQWAKYARQLCQERILCELCSECGRLSPVVRPEKAGRSVTSIVDHIVPVNGPDDPLFWEPVNHWCLCVACDRWKSIRFDGSYGHTKRVAGDRSLAGIAARRAEVVRERKADAGNATVVPKRICDTDVAR